jgi:hypothetical protein
MEEIQEEVAVSNASEQPTFDPTKKYTWQTDAAITITGAEFGLILNALRAIVNTPEAQSLFLAAEATDKIEGVLARNVTNGNIVEAPEAPKGSL